MSALSDRVTRLRSVLAESNLDALLVAHPANRRYLSGFTGTHAFVLVSADGTWLSTDSRYWEQAETQCPDFQLHRQEGGVSDWLPGLLTPLAGRKVGFEAEHLTVSLHKQMRDIVSGMAAPERPALVQSEAVVEQLRVIKDEEELKTIECAVRLGDAAFAAVAERIEPGWSETQVAWEIERYAREHGASAMSFATIVGGGPWGAMPHAYPRQETIAAGQPIVIDMGVVVDGYCSDMTRTIVLGEPDAKFQEIYDIVLTAQETAEATLEAGMLGREVHALAEDVIASAGYGNQFGHGLGHGVGLEVHELPRLGRTVEEPLEEGMVITVEPGIYLPGWGGIRIEDMGVIENGKFRNFTTAAKLRMID
ncbi:MAG TPA: Xaa-Pro peptidase family protein [Dehalococcoidia bacterium]|nr:Xaa-Pro peptidase family protein [Dehalococcoidia bacterium]